MPYAKNVELLEPIDLSEHLDKVELYLGQVCQIAGISKMQLDYWTNKAQIPTKGKKQRIYDIDALFSRTGPRGSAPENGPDLVSVLPDGPQREQSQHRATPPPHPPAPTS